MCRTASEVRAENPWGLLAGALAEIARHDPRPAVADAAAAALLEIMEVHCSAWDSDAWNSFYLRGPGYMLELPDSLPSQTGGAVLKIIFFRPAGDFLCVVFCACERSCAKYSTPGINLKSTSVLKLNFLRCTDRISGLERGRHGTYSSPGTVALWRHRSMHCPAIQPDGAYGIHTGTCIPGSS